MSLAGPTQPWERITWPDERIQIINRDMGLYLFAQKQQVDTATTYFNKALELKNDDWRAYYYRSKCKSNIAQTNEALEDALKAANYTGGPNNLVDLQECDCVYAMNEFEKANLLLHQKRKMCAGTKVGFYDARLCVTKENIKDAIGDVLGPFMQKNAKIFPTVLEDLRRRNEVDPRPLWKILKASGSCDILSILDIEEKIISPCEKARRERAFKIFNETYLNKSWQDVIFLRNLRKNPTLLLRQTPHSTPQLRSLVNSKYQTVNKFLKMLHARCPMYSLREQSFPNKAVYENYLQNHLNRVQYQTRRNMSTILRNINIMRKKQDIVSLCKYVEEVMGQYVVVKTERVMPWKFEFINEVYNTLALAFTDLCVIPDDFASIPFELRKKVMYRLPIDQKEPPALFVFGDKSTVQDPNASDRAMLNYRNKITRYEKRMQHAKYSIEKCYLLHEMARTHLVQCRFDECISTARKAFEESSKCNSYIWKFLSEILILKSHAHLQRIEREQECLVVAGQLAVKLKSPQLISFINGLELLNQIELNIKSAISHDHSLHSRSGQSSTSRFRVENSYLSVNSRTKEDEV